MSEPVELGPAPELNSLVGLRLSIIRRALDMLILHFGILREVRTRKGNSALVGEFAIHVSGPWRIDGPELTLAGQDDLYRFAGAAEPVDWTYEKGNTRLDAELDTAFGPAAVAEWRLVSDGFEVVSADMSRFGDLHIRFANGFAVRGFPADVGSECWRLYQPDGKTDHLVVPDYSEG
nr:hypothetical protein [Mesorhizobium sp.]